MLIAGTKCVATNGLSLSLLYLCFVFLAHGTPMDGKTKTYTHQLISQEEPEKGTHIQNETEQAKSNGPWRGECMKGILYAGLDAIVTCFALISSISGSHLSSGQTPFLFFLFQFLHAPHYPIMCLDSEDS
ncbi:hypothetical protein NE237_012259 [Protea cynaroides]|uniref:Uncharacterized protein n=1 Tax=Protea cynaroides TaxID=273540 RepID=A0A9Q0GWG5_9MAGN|nr:hypothetical protein NE237_012259 [Protea cynaroides]